MSRPNPLILFAILAAVLAVLSGLSLAKGGLFFARHEGDMLHLLAILFRMDAGQVPHLDFMTPIGAFAFLPIQVAMGQGLGVGEAILWAQSGVALLMLPLIWWAGWTRFNGAAGYAFGLACLFLVLAVVHGETVNSASMSMHYNRWAWALAYVAVALAVLPARGRAFPLVDGAIIGLAVACLTMIKVTYVVGLAPALLLGMILQQDRRALITALLFGLAVAAAVTLWAGFDYWAGYIGDLLAVTGSEVRSKPSLGLGATLGAPAYLGGTLSALAGVVLLRQAGAEKGGLLVLVLFPGFAYITFQNFANDPQWLVLMGLLLFMFLSEANAETTQARAVPFVATALLAFAVPIFLNLATSPVVHWLVDEEKYTPLFPDAPRHAGLQTAKARAHKIDAVTPLDGPGTGLEAYADLAVRPDQAVFRGETFERCNIAIGLPGWMTGMAKDIEAAGFADGTHILVADVVGAQWLFNSQEPITNGAPWYYGGLPGIENADYVLVPTCPIVEEVRALVIDALNDSDWTFQEVHRSPLYILYSVS